MNNVLKYLNNKLKTNAIIVVATSGGPDSMCLLHLLCNLKEKLNLKIIVAHVNHKLREESEEEAEFVKEFSEYNNLIYEYMEIKEYNNDNLESEARKKRYEFFNELINRYQANFLMTAHHGDDLMETILMRLVRGSSIKGYSGFKKEIKINNYELLRPLITLTKDDILNYMDENNYKYYIDKTNFSKKYTRNRYRLDVLPFLKNENKDVHLKFLKFSEELNEVNNYIEKYIKDILKNIKNEKGINIKELLEYDNFIIKKIIEYELSLIYINDLFLVNDNNVLEIIKLLKNNKSNGKIELPNNYLCLKEYNYFKIVNNNKDKDYEYLLKDIVKVPTGIIKIIDDFEDTSNYTIRLNSNEIKLPLIIRNRKDGDKIKVLNLNGTKKVKDILIDEKISVEKRDKIPIVLDSNNNILWIPGIKKSIYDKTNFKKNTNLGVNYNEFYDIIVKYEEE